MIPLFDDYPKARPAIAVYSLIALNLVIFSHQVGLPADRLIRFIRAWAFIPSEFFRSPLNLDIVTAQFLHGDILHLLGNMWFLWVFGRSLESVLGSMPFLIFYLVTGTAALFAQGVVAPGSAIPLIGASGAIAGVMGGYVVSFPRARINTLMIIIIFITTVQIPALVFLGVWFAIETVRAATTNPGMPGVAYLAHAAGFAVGMGVIGLLRARAD
ncbi:MAG: rhomboid family intramembrane serine protease [Pseudanabaenaceae cyanobacterium bins.68]|nr:rhomboid family intramembrane serine protease [Pseudanabaenaceae cyanobacterium bins.68]